MDTSQEPEVAWALLALLSGALDTRLQPIYHTPGVGAVGYAGDPNGLMYRKDTGSPSTQT